MYVYIDYVHKLFSYVYTHTHKWNDWDLAQWHSSLSAWMYTWMKWFIFTDTFSKCCIRTEIGKPVKWLGSQSAQKWLGSQSFTCVCVCHFTCVCVPISLRIQHFQNICVNINHFIHVHTHTHRRINCDMMQWHSIVSLFIFSG